MPLGLDAATWAIVVVGLVIAAVIFVRSIKGGGTPKWHPRPPSSRERIIAGVWLLAFLVALTNYYAGWRLFGGYDNWAVLAMFLGGLLIRRLPGVTRT